MSLIDVIMYETANQINLLNDQICGTSLTPSRIATTKTNHMSELVQNQMCHMIHKVHVKYFHLAYTNKNTQHQTVS